MHVFDYENGPRILLTPEITALVGAIREYKGRQDLYLNARTDVLNALMEVAKVQSTTSSNRIEGIVNSRMSKAERVRKVFETTLGRVAKRDVLVKCPDISTAMVEMTLKAMLDEGLIRKVGKGKSTAYVRNV